MVIVQSDLMRNYSISLVEGSGKRFTHLEMHSMRTQLNTKTTSDFLAEVSGRSCAFERDLGGRRRRLPQAVSHTQTPRDNQTLAPVSNFLKIMFMILAGRKFPDRSSEAVV
jgi:hypothetical protein